MSLNKLVLPKKAALNFAVARYQDGSPELLTWNDETGDVSKQVTQLISRYADFPDVVGWKIAAFYALLGRNVFMDMDGESGEFRFAAFGLSIHVCDIASSTEEEGYDEIGGGFWEVGDYRCTVGVIHAVDGHEAKGRFFYGGGGTQDLAETIIDALLCGRTCQLCGRLNGGGNVTMDAFICTSCLSGDIKTPCLHCGECWGAPHDIFERFHHLCYQKYKRRRLN